MSKKSPQLRFEGFTDDWEERKLKDVLYISKARNKSHKYGKEDVLSVSREVGTVNQIEYQGRSFAGSDISNYKVVQGGELIYTKSPLKGAPYGIFQVATLEGILSPLYAVYNSTDKAYTPFVAMALKTDSIATHYLSPLVAKGAKNTINVTDEGALQGKIKFPNILEQKQIFIFFKQLDHTIALHQRKLDLLKEQKKGYLQKMFPKNGAKVPELRFAGFADDWEERKLRDLLNKNSEKNKNLSVINVESVSNKTGFTKQTDQFEDYSVASADLSNYYVIREKQFAYNPSRINVGSIAYKDLGDEISVVSPLYVSFSTKKVLNDGFLWNWFKTASFDAQRQRLSEGGVRDTLSFNQLSEMNTMFPTYPEQEKIGSFFQQLDETIALHQRKLDLLKEQKKGFLQKMFV